MTRDMVQQVAARCFYNVLRGPVYALAALFFGFRAFGREHVPPTGPVLVVANHQSNLDPPLVGLALSRQLKYLARHGLFFWPFSWLISALGAVPLDKKAGGLGGMRTTLKLLKENEAVLVFPEGSRTSDGALGPLLPGFCVLARRSGATIVPVAIEGAYAALPRGSSLPRPQQITVVVEPAITPGEVAKMSDEELVEITRKRINRGREAARQLRLE
jgi:1-acyl-sn-glycerol-3-phosphate acyltransferase